MWEPEEVQTRHVDAASKVYLHYLETVESFIFASEENISSTNAAVGGAADTRTADPLVSVDLLQSQRWRAPPTWSPCVSTSDLTAGVAGSSPFRRADWQQRRLRLLVT